jgi:crotonobetainyl-CoA:carnitine CoA-transferase CaiB-like acyl-CoA transferase
VASRCVDPTRRARADRTAGRLRRLDGGDPARGRGGAALFQRERTGKPAVVDVSLLNTAMWVLAPDIVASRLIGANLPTAGDQTQAPNPLVNTYPTKDRRWLSLILLQPDRYWADLCQHLDRAELADDPRFADAAARFEHRVECVAALDEIFATRTLAEWRQRLGTFEGVWAPLQTPLEVHDDHQALANGYLPELRSDTDQPFRLVASPVQFDETPPELQRAPEHGQHTEEVLLELGLGWDQIIAHKEAGAVL